MDHVQLRRTLQHHLVQTFERQGSLDPHEVSGILGSFVNELSGKVVLPDLEFSRLYNQLAHEMVLYGPLWLVMYDRTVTEVMVNDVDKVFVEREGKVQPEPRVRFRDIHQYRHTMDRVLSMEAAARLDTSKPMVDLALPDGSRCNMTIPPAAHNRPAMTIRKYAGTFHGTDDLIEAGSLDERMAFLLAAATRARVNILFSGGTGTGKTTLLEVLTRTIPEEERIVCIEDTLEIRVDHPNTVRMLTREKNIEGKGQITIGDLFRNSLRMCPDRVLLGEIRGKEAFDYLQALNSGHDGSLAVLHASTPEEAVVRLQNLVPLAGLGVPPRVVKRQIAHGLDLIVQIDQLTDGSRKVTRISEVGELDANEDLVITDLFRFESAGLREGRIEGRYVATGAIPGFMEQLELSGMEVPRALFDAD